MSCDNASRVKSVSALVRVRQVTLAEVEFACPWSFPPAVPVRGSGGLGNVRGTTFSNCGNTSSQKSHLLQHDLLTNSLLVASELMKIRCSSACRELALALPSELWMSAIWSVAIAPAISVPIDTGATFVFQSPKTARR